MTLSSMVKKPLKNNNYKDEMEDKKYFQLIPWGLNGVILPEDKVLKTLKDLLSEGDEITVKAVKMTDEEYKKLPEFQGF